MDKGKLLFFFLIILGLAILGYLLYDNYYFPEQPERFEIAHIERVTPRGVYLTEFIVYDQHGRFLDKKLGKVFVKNNQPFRIKIGFRYGDYGGNRDPTRASIECGCGLIHSFSLQSSN